MQKVMSIRSDKKKSFSYIHKYTNTPEFEDFNLHAHTDYEIFIFIKGDVNFVVEGVSYQLMPYDILLIKGNDLHQIFPNPDVEYERIVINISEEFFNEMQCSHLKEIFSTEKKFISASETRKCKIDENIERIEKYISRTTRQQDIIIKCVLTELVYNLSTVTPSTGSISKNKTVSKIISYINTNPSLNISLDELAEKFFLSKFYMCRLFKKNTGFTINQYITNKRILLVKKLHKEGYSLSNASIEAGFGSYANFYKAYVKEFGISPKLGIKNY